MTKPQVTFRGASARAATAALALMLCLPAAGQAATAATTSTQLNFGSVSAVTTLPLTYVPLATGTITTPTTLTDGVVSPTGDYQISAGGTCTPAVTAGTACTINVTFTPAFAGLRKGAVRITDPSGSVITTYLTGVGNGAQLAFGPATQGKLAITGTTAASPRGVAVDGGGNVYYADDATNTINKVTPAGAGGTIFSAAAGVNLGFPGGVAVDGAGNVFAADYVNGRLVELPFGSTTAVVPKVTGLVSPSNLAADGLGNVYIANNGGNNVTVYSAITGTQKTLSTGTLTLAGPSGVAVDSAGNIYVADTGNNRVIEVPATGTPKVLIAAVTAVQALAVDAAGDLYIAANGQILVLPAGGTKTSTLATGLGSLWSLAVTPAGDLYASIVGPNFAGGSVIKLNQSSPTVTFPSVGSGGVGAAQSITLDNIGNGPLTIGSGGVSAGFTLQLATTTCSTATPLAAAATCTASVSFTPTTVGANTGTLTVNTNAANGVATVNLSGTATAGVQTIQFPAITGAVYVGESGTPAVAASSGLPVTITSSTTTVCTVTAANLVTAVAAGNCTLNANQAGNATVAAAPQVSQTFAVQLNPQQIIFPTIPSLPKGLSGAVPVSASSGLPVTVTSSTPAVCTVTGLTGTLVAAGTCTLTASQAGNSTYAAAPAVTQSFTVTP